MGCVQSKKKKCGRVQRMEQQMGYIEQEYTSRIVNGYSGRGIIGWGMEEKCRTGRNNMKEN